MPPARLPSSRNHFASAAAKPAAAPTKPAATRSRTLSGNESISSLPLHQKPEIPLPVCPECPETIEAARPWVECVFQRRECCQFVPVASNSARCGCGRNRNDHLLSSNSTLGLSLRWSVEFHTEASPTDAFGTIEFQGGPHPNKAQYVRVAHDTRPQELLQLLQSQWGLELPKLVISVQGGIANFEMQPKLKRVFRKGLLRAAKTTGAWIISGGTNTGVMKHVGDALGDTLVQSRNNIITIGIAPWGVVHNRVALIGRDKVVPYHAVASPKSNNVVLNSNHSYFILVDNGTVGKFGCEIILRRSLEKFVSQQKITMRSGHVGYSTPVVSLVLEGGSNTIRMALECVTDNPPVPIVICDGSGRAADLIAFTHKYAQDDGKHHTMPQSLRDQLIATIEKTFQYSRQQAESVFIELMLCVKKRELITVFRMGEADQDIDLPILTALLKGQNAKAPDQLSLALSWNRADIARSHIFVYGQEWPEGALEQAMLDALIGDRVEFVQLLLENGVDIYKWLTISRLEDLYNLGLKMVPVRTGVPLLGIAQKQDSASTLRYLIRENVKHIPPDYRYTLYDIGQVMEKLMGGAYRASYCRRKFRAKYNAIMKRGQHSISHLVTEVPIPMASEIPLDEQGFQYPFSELMVWAVLLRRQKLAIFLWKHGEEALSKALVACKLLKSMAHEAEQDDLEIDVSQELRAYAREFSSLAVDLLQHCYEVDDDLTEQLLTYELPNWSNQTCLSLAVSASHRDFLANTCCQILLTDMWMGGLRMRKYTSLKVILGIFIMPTILFLEFKSKEELQLMPQTVEEHLEELEDSDSDSGSSVDSSEAQVEPEHPSAPPVASEAETLPRFDVRPLTNGEMFNRGFISANAFTSPKKSPLRLGKKIYEFYTAPITKFWMHTIAFIIFLSCFTYVVLVKTPVHPTLLEWLVISYVIGLTMEKFRELVVSEPKKWSQKLWVYFSEVWNISDAIGILLFLIGMALRLHPITLSQGRVFYCVSIIFWFVRILDLFSVSKHLGPYVMMIGKMVKDMLSFIVILLIMLMAFGVLRQSISFPDEEPSWYLARDIFLKPYFMLYGEVYAGEIECSDEPDAEFKCVTGHWVVPAVMAIYLIVCNILLINLLIAVFNNTFLHVNSMSTQVWKFQRYSLVIEYELRPILPPPLILLCHIYLLIKYICRRCKQQSEYSDNGLKLFVTDECRERLHDFEEECLEDYFRNKDSVFQASAEERVRVTTDRVENLSLRLDDMNQKESSMKQVLLSMDHRMARLEEAILLSAQSLTALQQQFVAHSASPPFPSPSISHGPRLPLNPNPISYPPPDPHMWASNTNSRSMLSRTKRQAEAKLRPFTDYSRRQRPRFSRAISLDAASSYDYYIPSPSGNFQQQDSKLYQRRKCSADPLSSNESLEAPSQKGGARKRHRNMDLKVGFGDIGKSSNRTQTASSSAQYTTAKPMSYVQTVTQDSCAVFANPFDSFEETSPPCCIPDDLPLPPFSVMTPIVTPTRSEYSSITDNIDTSCVNYGSPPGSPQTPRHVFSADPRDSQAQPLSVPVKRRHKSKADQQLKHAEESEHDQMEQMIRKRIRQISLTESDSLGDMAKHVMNDIDLKEEDEHSTAYFSGDETSKDDAAPKGLKSVKSEPSFHYSFSPPSLRHEEYLAVAEEEVRSSSEDLTSPEPAQSLPP